MISFGTIVAKDGEDFVFLMHDLDHAIMYLAKILDSEKSRMLEAISAKRTQPKYSYMLCFVKLTTDLYAGRLATLMNTDHPADSIFTSIGDLNAEDTKDLVAEILREEASVPIALKKYVQSL